MTVPAAYTDSQLWRLIFTLEDEMCAEGIAPKARHFQLPVRAMERLGFRSFAVAGSGVPPLLKRIEAMHGTLYRRKDVAAGGVHGGAFMFRGIATNVHVPIIYGTVAIDPFSLCDLSARQIDWLKSSRGQERACHVNFYNLFDFAGCLHPMGGYGAVPKRALPLLQLSALQTQGAAATLCAAFDERGAVQSALIAAELSIKGALAGAGAQERELRALGHDFGKIAGAVNEAYEKFDLKAVMEDVRDLPELVPNRYSGEARPNAFNQRSRPMPRPPMAALRSVSRVSKEVICVSVKPMPLSLILKPAISGSEAGLGRGEVAS